MMQAIPLIAPTEVKRSRKKAKLYLAVHYELNVSPEALQQRQDAEYAQALADGLSRIDFSEVSA